MHVLSVLLSRLSSLPIQLTILYIQYPQVSHMFTVLACVVSCVTSSLVVKSLPCNPAVLQQVRQTSSIYCPLISELIFSTAQVFKRLTWW